MKKYGLLFPILLFSTAFCSVTFLAGHVYLSNFEYPMNATCWAGYYIISSGNFSGENYTVKYALTPTQSQIYNLVLDMPQNGYIIISLKNETVNISKIVKPLASDLQPDALFDQTRFPYFYPNYFENPENPNNTFCCTYGAIQELSLEGFVISVQGMDYYLLNYTGDPLFIGKISNGEAKIILPVNNTYYVSFVALRKVIPSAPPSAEEGVTVGGADEFEVEVIGEYVDEDFLVLVTDNGKPLDNVKVFVVELGTTFYTKDGKTTIRFPATGTYTLILSKPGYVRKTITLEVKEPKYELVLSRETLRVGDILCISLFRNGEEYSGVVTLISGDTEFEVEVPGKFCFPVYLEGEVRVIFKDIQKRIYVEKVKPIILIYEEIEKRPQLLVILGAVVTLIVTWLREKLSRFKKLFKVR